MNWTSDPFLQGCQARLFGSGLKDCPYERGSKAGKKWVDGYLSVKRRQLFDQYYPLMMTLTTPTGSTTVPMGSTGRLNKSDPEWQFIPYKGMRSLPAIQKLPPIRLDFTSLELRIQGLLSRDYAGSLEDTILDDFMKGLR